MIDPTTLLATIPPGLRTPLVERFQEIVRNYIERRWEPAELNGAKFCEVVYTVLAGSLSGSYAATPSKPDNFVGACRALEAQSPNATRVGDRSLRILIPRMLPALYEIRNNRNVGHVGGEVDPNHEDAEVVLGMTSWVMAELVRIFHNVPLAEAQEAVDVLVERRHPLIWRVEATKRVLDPDLSMTDQTLLLLHSESGWVDVSKLFEWVEYSSLSAFKSKVLVPKHDARLLEYEASQNRVRLTPRGVEYVEKNLLSST